MSHIPTFCCCLLCFVFVFNLWKAGSKQVKLRIGIYTSQKVSVYVFRSCVAGPKERRVQVYKAHSFHYHYLNIGIFFLPPGGAHIAGPSHDKLHIGPVFGSLPYGNIYLVPRKTTNQDHPGTTKKQTFQRKFLIF